jgi:mannonate dehydratase
MNHHDSSDTAPPDFDRLPMRVGLGTFMDPNSARLRYIKQLGVNDVLLNLWGAKEAGYPNLPLEGSHEWSFQSLLQLRNQVENQGIRLKAIENLPYSFYDDIMLGGPDRDEQLEHVKTTIRNMGAAGIATLGYNWMPNGVWRSSTKYPIRGGALSSAIDMEQLDRAPQTHDRTYTESEMWENYEYFLQEVLPVAEDAGVTLALHPDDPPAESLGGIARPFRTPDALERAMELVPSDNHALEFCLGNFAAMGADIPKEIERFGARDEIEYVHFQTISSSLPRFHEVFIDQEGQYDPYAVISALAEADFNGMIIPGHAPKMEGDDTTLNHNDQATLDVHSDGWKERGRGFTVGYLKALIAAYDAEYGDDYRSISAPAGQEL